MVNKSEITIDYNIRLCFILVIITLGCVLFLKCPIYGTPAEYGLICVSLHYSALITSSCSHYIVMRLLHYRLIKAGYFGTRHTDCFIHSCGAHPSSYSFLLFMQSPKNTRISVRFVNTFSMRCSLGCDADWVEVRLKSVYRPGPR